MSIQDTYKIDEKLEIVQTEKYGHWDARKVGLLGSGETLCVIF